MDFLVPNLNQGTFQNVEAPLSTHPACIICAMCIVCARYYRGRGEREGYFLEEQADTCRMQRDNTESTWSKAGEVRKRKIALDSQVLTSHSQLVLGALRVDIGRGTDDQH